MAQDVESLGCRLVVDRNSATWTLTEEKRQKWSSEISSALDAGELGSEEAGRFAGRLMFGAQRVFGRVGRAALRPLFIRQGQPHRRRLASRLRCALRWWLEYLSTNPQQTARPRPSSQQPEWCLYTDAESTGHVGAVLVRVADGRMWHLEAQTPRCIRKALLCRETQIIAHEAAAVVVGLATFGRWMAGQRAVLFVDNQPVLNMLIKGWSRSEDTNDLVDWCWMQLATLGIDGQFEYVASKANIADGPSRRDISLLKELGSTECVAEWRVH